MTEVVRITQPEAFLLTVLQDLLLECMKTNKLIRDPQAAVVELAGQVHREDVGLFVAGKKNAWDGVLLAQWNRSALSPGCVIVHIFNRGGRQVRDSLVSAGVDYARQGGYDRIIAMWHDDDKAALARVFSALGEPVEAGKMIVFDLNESLI